MELIIVITILIILLSIGFISFSNYTSESRDIVRKNDLKNIEKILHLYETENGLFPESKDEKEFGEEQFLKVKLLNKLPVDPKTGEKYFYKTSGDLKEYKLQANLETGEKFTLTNKKGLDGNSDIESIIEKDNQIHSSFSFELDGKGRISKIFAGKIPGVFHDKVIYKSIKIKFTQEMIDKISSIKVKKMLVDDWGEIKVNDVSVISGPFPWFKDLVFCTLDNKNIFSSLNSNPIQNSNSFVGDKEINFTFNTLGRKFFYDNYKISYNNNCKNDTKYWIDQVDIWIFEDGKNIYNMRNNRKINLPFIGVNKTTKILEDENILYTAKNFKDLLKVGYNDFEYFYIVGGSGQFQGDIEIKYID